MGVEIFMAWGFQGAGVGGGRGRGGGGGGDGVGGGRGGVEGGGKVGARPVCEVDVWPVVMRSLLADIHRFTESQKRERAL